MRAKKPHPLPALLLAPLFSRSLTVVPRSLTLNHTETLATRAKPKAFVSQGGKFSFLASNNGNQHKVGAIYHSSSTIRQSDL